jgi:hypothetical protein
MGALDLTIGILDDASSSLQRRFCVRRDAQGLTIHCGAMQAYIRDVDETRVEVAYESAIHETTRERLHPTDAARLILAIVQRNRLCKINLANAQPDDTSD